MTAARDSTVTNSNQNPPFSEFDQGSERTPSDIAYWRAITNDQKNRIQALEKECQLLHGKCSQLDADYTELERNYDELERLNQMLQDNITSLTAKMEKQLKEKTTALNELETELVRVERERRESGRALDILRQEFDTYRTRVGAEMRVLHETLNTEVDTRRSAEKRIAELQARVVDLEQTVEQLEQRVRVLATENEHLRATNEHLLEDLALAQTEAEERKTHAAERERRLVEEINDLKAELFVRDHKSSGSVTLSTPSTSTPVASPSSSSSLASAPFIASFRALNSTALSLVEDALSLVKRLSSPTECPPRNT